MLFAILGGYTCTATVADWVLLVRPRSTVKNVSGDPMPMNSIMFSNKMDYSFNANLMKNGTSEWASTYHYRKWNEDDGGYTHWTEESSLDPRVRHLAPIEDNVQVYSLMVSMHHEDPAGVSVVYPPIGLVNPNCQLPSATHTCMCGCRVDCV